MIYKILIKDTVSGTMVYDKKNVLDDEGNVMTEDFTAETKEDAAAEYIKLLDTYKKEQLDVVADMKEEVSVTVAISELNPPDGE